jgi:hypothetical protein
MEICTLEGSNPPPISFLEGHDQSLPKPAVEYHKNLSAPRKMANGRQGPTAQGAGKDSSGKVRAREIRKGKRN